MSEASKIEDLDLVEEQGTQSSNSSSEDDNSGSSEDDSSINLDDDLLEHPPSCSSSEETDSSLTDLSTTTSGSGTPRTSEDESDGYDKLCDFRNARDEMRFKRLRAVMHEEECQEEQRSENREKVQKVPNNVIEETDAVNRACIDSSFGKSDNNTGSPVSLEEISWREDFSSFSGKEETYLRKPGPTVTTKDPVEIFMAVWDDKIMEMIVRATNSHASKTVTKITETENGIPDKLKWTDTTVEEMYRYLAITIVMSVCYRPRKYYWDTGFLEMPIFQKLMSRNRFIIITEFLNFQVNDVSDPDLTSYQRHLLKITPILNHCNQKFASLYTPNKHLCLDESQLLWKGRQSKCIGRGSRSQYGIKSYELCEATSGYLLKCLLSAGLESLPKPIPGFASSTSQAVLEIMDGFLDTGHTLVMDCWYNHIPLTRVLKQRCTDVIGIIHQGQRYIPEVIKLADEKHLAKGQHIYAHCGDISLFARKDETLATTLSTYHTDRMVPSQSAKKADPKPEAFVDYEKYRNGGVYLKDKQLSIYPMERKVCKRDLRIFQRLFNTSILNIFIIYTQNTLNGLSHTDLRINIVEGLLERFPLDKRLIENGLHFPQSTETEAGNEGYLQTQCARCAAASELKCSFCDVALCAGTCWLEYHTLVDLNP